MALGAFPERTQLTQGRKAEEPGMATPGDQRIVLSGIGWEGYSRLLRLRGDRSRPRMVYLDGDLYLMSPAYRHSFLAKRLGLLVMVVVEELEIPCVPSGDTTLRRKKKQGGAEADESFYLKNFALIAAKQGKDDIRLRHDPPPDLVIEVENTHPADPAIEAWRRFGVPEVWICDGESLRVLVLQEDGSYLDQPNSLAFPWLSASEILDWVNRPVVESETTWIKALRRWVVEVVAPRR